MKLFLFFNLYSLIFILAFTPAAQAQTMENDMYIIDEGDVSTFDTDLNITNEINLPSTENSGEYSGSNYSVRLGAHYYPDRTPLIFSISNLLVDFGTLSPTNPILRSVDLNIRNQSVYGYKITTAQNNELTEIKSGEKIPDTTCDDGKCSEVVSSIWENTLSYGFGYRCDSVNGECAEGDDNFKEKSFFKQFPDTTRDESATTILTGGPEMPKEASLTFKVNIPSSQPQGIYSNTITLLAIPSY